MFFKNIGFVRGGSANVLGEIKNCGRWSEIVAVMLQGVMSFEITLLKILLKIH